jgi:hypothetical protein
LQYEAEIEPAVCRKMRVRIRKGQAQEAVEMPEMQRNVDHGATDPGEAALKGQKEANFLA